MGPYMKTPLTEEQAADLRDCWMEWIRIRTENGKPEFPTSSDVYKGCLLGRMTMQGKPPLPDPPPTSYSAPWYELIEKNGADLQGNWFQHVEGPYDGPLGKEGKYFSICQDLWLIVLEVDGVYTLNHPRAPGDWKLRHRTEADPVVRGGMTLKEDGRYVPYYLTEKDWILIGPTDGG